MVHIAADCNLKNIIDLHFFLWRLNWIRIKREQTKHGKCTRRREIFAREGEQPDYMGADRLAIQPVRLAVASASLLSVWRLLCKLPGRAL